VVELLLCILIIGGFFLLRAVLATIVFYQLLPKGDRCLNCDAPTLRTESRFWSITMPGARPSWCYECGWHGLLRSGPLTASSAALTSAKVD